MQQRKQVSDRKLAAAATLAASFLSMLLLDYPGHLSYDSVVQLLEGRTGNYADWHPPVMSWLLGLADALLPGTGLFICFSVALLFGSLFSLLWTRTNLSWALSPVVALCALLPQLLIYQGTVWKDVLFANASVAGFVCLVHVAERWPRPRLRFPLIALGFLLLALATLTRQNGVIVLLAGAAALAWIAFSRRARKFRLSPLAYGFGALLGAVAFSIAARAGLEQRIVDDTGPGAQITLLEVYDIAGALKRQPSFDLAEIRRVDPDLEARFRTRWAPHYSLRWVDALDDEFIEHRQFDPDFRAAVRRQWLDLVLHHSLLYLRVRAAVFRWVVLTPGMSDDLCLPYSLGVSGPQEEMDALGMKPRWTATDDALDDYASDFVDTPAMSHVTYAGIAILALGALIFRRRPGDIAMAAMLVSALAFAASFFFISIACDYRYLYLLDLSALVALIYLAMDFDLSIFARFSCGRETSP
jgi:hypothetical protein